MMSGNKAFFRQSVRSSVASSIIEATFCIVFFIPFVLLLVDFGLVVLVSIWNHDVCCYAARHASRGLPDAISKGAPRKRAVDALKSVVYPRTLMTIEPNIDVRETVKPIVDGDVFGGQVEGTVTVSTVAEVAPPFLLLPILGKSKISLSASQTYPYTSTLTAPSQSLAQ